MVMQYIAGERCPVCGGALFMDTNKAEWGGRVRIGCFNGHDNITRRETDRGDRAYYPGYVNDSRQNPGNYRKAPKEPGRPSDAHQGKETTRG